jgi:hypothetical protein
LKALKEKATSLEDKKSATFFKITDLVNELQGPPLIKDSMSISLEEMETELARLRDKWVEEFDSLSYFSGDNMCTWTIDYVNVNHNISISIY